MVSTHRTYAPLVPRSRQPIRTRSLHIARARHTHPYSASAPAVTQAGAEFWVQYHSSGAGSVILPRVRASMNQLAGRLSEVPERLLCAPPWAALACGASSSYTGITLVAFPMQQRLARIVCAAALSSWRVEVDCAVTKSEFTYRRLVVRCAPCCLALRRSAARQRDRRKRQ